MVRIDRATGRAAPGAALLVAVLLFASGCGVPAGAFVELRPPARGGRPSVVSMAAIDCTPDAYCLAVGASPPDAFTAVAAEGSTVAARAASCAGGFCMVVGDRRAHPCGYRSRIAWR